jgi:hypothetical protein
LRRQKRRSGTPTPLPTANSLLRQRLPRCRLVLPLQKLEKLEKLEEAQQ